MRTTILLKIAFLSLSRNKLRTFLTMLGIIIGVAAVITMMAVGTGARLSVEAAISSLGTNVINVYPGSRNLSGARQEAGTASRFTEAEADAIYAESPAVRYITPVVRSMAQFKFGNRNWRTRVHGVYAEYLFIRDWGLAQGAAYGPSEERGGAKVCILGSTVAAGLFEEGVDPIGKTIRINNLPFRVIGVLESKGQSSFGQDQDDIVLAPFSTVQKKMLGTTYVESLFASAISEEAIPEASAQIESILRRRLRIAANQESDFNIRTQTEITEAATSTSRTLALLLSSIAGISLLVGGIGIMNIMLVSVTERTREIGIRLALGARGRDIRLQFLVEAVAISLLGGILGISLGVGASQFLASAQGWAVEVSTASILMAFGFSFATGVFFGWYPAGKASRLNPIDALRFE